MRIYKILFLSVVFVMSSLDSISAVIQYHTKDSILVESLLKESVSLNDNTNLVLFYGRKLIGIPYVAKTLEYNSEEKLVVNLRQLDCTTFVETVLALSFCARNKQYSFREYCHCLMKLRYRKAQVKYTERLHYFSQWIESNTVSGFVKETIGDASLYSAKQMLHLNYMTQHTELYPMMHGKSDVIEQIKKYEDSLYGVEYRYIPKQSVNNSALLRNTVSDGDVLAIVTRKTGLDISHIGFAVWHKDGLHLLNASSIHKCVVEESMTLQAYMQKHPSQLGIRVIHPML